MGVCDASGNALSEICNSAGVVIASACDASGNIIYPATFNKVLLNEVLMSTLNPSKTITPQGFAIYGDYYFQFFTGDDTMRIFSMVDYSLVGNYAANDIAHANNMFFGTVVQDTGFPLLYVVEHTLGGRNNDSKVVDVLKVSLNGYEIVSTYTIGGDCGDYPGCIIDWNTDTVYAIGYNDYPTDATQMILTVYSMSDWSTPTHRVVLPMMGILNGLEFHNGKLLYIGNTWNDSQLILSEIDVNTFEITPHYYSKSTDSEYEDCCVVGNALYLSQWDRTDNLYYRLYSMDLPA